MKRPLPPLGRHARSAGAGTGKRLARAATGADRWLGPALAGAALSLAVGWLAPMMTVERLFLFEREVSLIGALATLWQDGEILLAAIIGLFSILFPLAKILLSLRLWWFVPVDDPVLPRRLARLESLGKWSMLDVFLVAITVATVKISLISDVHLHWGLYAFAAGALASMAIFARMTRLARRIAAHYPTGRHPNGRHPNGRHPNGRQPTGRHPT